MRYRQQGHVLAELSAQRRLDDRVRLVICQPASVSSAIQASAPHNEPIADVARGSGQQRELNIRIIEDVPSSRISSLLLRTIARARARI